MIKVCENCQAAYKTKDTRQKTCGKACASIRQKNTTRKAMVRTDAVIVSAVRAPAASLFDLPPPEELPAPYAKRVYDMWAALTGDGEVATRIA